MFFYINVLGKRRPSKLRLRSIEPVSTTPSCSCTSSSESELDLDEDVCGEARELDETNEVTNQSRCKQCVRELLHNQGLAAYLASNVGGGLHQTGIKTLILRLADLLVWTFAKHHGQLLTEANAMQWMKEFITKRFKLIGPYVEYLQRDRERTPATILHNLNDIKKGVIWFLSFRQDDHEDEDDDLAIQRPDVDALFHIIKSISRQLGKQLRRDRSSDMKNTLSGIVFQRHLPTSGLKGLVANLREQMNWLTPFMEKTKSNECVTLLDKEIYDLYMQTLYASLYVFSPQGRVGGIADLTCNQGMEMLKYGYTQSNAFKTCGTYGYQPVLIADIASSLLEHYVYYLRPKVSGVETITTPTSPLWIKFNGKRCKNYDISHNVTR